MGQIVADEWIRTAHIRPRIELDAFEVMPNHVHGILVIRGRGTLQRAPITEHSPTVRRARCSVSLQKRFLFTEVGEVVFVAVEALGEDILEAETDRVLDDGAVFVGR